MTPRGRPVIFVGSSTEGESVVQAIQGVLGYEADVIPWRFSFELGRSSVDSLAKQLDKADFAILVMTPDDLTLSRTEEEFAPRDNVVFELGLFMGRIGFDRCYCVVTDSDRLKLPSDLSGISMAKYRPDHAGGLPSALGPACEQIRERIKDLGVRIKVAPANFSDYQNLLDFSSRISGFWWEFIKPVRISAIGLLTITQDLGAVSVRIHGRAYRPSGALAADWETVGCGAGFQDRRLLYMWRGRYSDKPTQPFEGYGDLVFHDGEGPFVTGHGVFSETNATDLTKTTKKTGEIVRCSKSEVDITQSGDHARIAELIRQKARSGG